MIAATDLVEPLRRRLEARTLRERWLLVAGACALALTAVYVFAISPLHERADRARAEALRLDADVTRTLQIASTILPLQADLARVEQRIQPGEKTNLLSVLEALASESRIGKENLESISPKRPSGNARYPETRVEVTLRDATLAQLVDYLYRIEHAPTLLIVRSLRIRARGGEESRIDAVFSVSTFERAA
jgi:hypothetical protein